MQNFMDNNIYFCDSKNALYGTGNEILPELRNAT